jgi:uncharacterized protein (TIGR00290 family)
MKKAFFNWSGGKDSALALFKLIQQGTYQIDCLLTTVNSKYKRISMHGVREELLEQQAIEIGLPLKKIYLPEFPEMEVYDRVLTVNLASFKKQEVDTAVFGDIFLDDLRTYRENQLKPLGLKAHFPLWKEDTNSLIREFIDLGFKTIVTCVSDNHLDKTFAGRIIDKEFIKDLPNGVDPCGENGEFHTFVFDGPIFKKPVNFTIGEITYKKYDNDEDKHLENGFWFCDIKSK